ncbi:acyl-CoA thioesterase [Aquibacillus halophilus]|uniref:Acyl-CoA thioesterase n=1 Tax=Aquibacillus halophilus TaxID=930132 RepID=A0A6A8DGU1_9BACI|nr:thioesterase family protein [Aquibacillus halophilus]MRH42931.1 acyl-CoA thioesterase [Aquibacillus halophilus]
MKAINYIEDFDQWKREFSFYIPIKIRFAETDMFGHLNNVFVFMYFEEARIELLKTVGFFQSSSKFDTMPIVADLQCDYIKQIYFHDELRVYVKVNYVGNTSLDIHYLVTNKLDEVCLTARGRMVQVNSTTGKPVPFTENMREKLLSI